MLTIPHTIKKNFISTQNAMINYGSIRVPLFILNSFTDIADKLKGITLPKNAHHDQLIWMHNNEGVMTSKLAYLHLKQHVNPVIYAITIWQNFIPPYCFFILGRFIHNRLLTDETL
jgi:hypothetical protein